MAFNREKFIKEASSEFTPDEINQYLTSRGEEPMNPLQTFLGKTYKADWLPLATGTVGAGVGTLAGPAGTLYGGTGGYGLGKMIQSTAGDIGGFSPTDPAQQRQQLGETVGGAVGFGAGAYSLTQLAQALKFLIQPTKTAGGWRESYLSKQSPEKSTKSYNQMDKALLAASEKGNTAAVKTATTQKATDLMGEFFPLKTVGNYEQISPETSISKQNAYNTLGEWEKLNKSYTGGPTAESMGAKNAATSARSLLSEGDTKLQLLNKLYQLGVNIEPYKKWIIGTGLTLPFARSLVYSFMNTLKGK